MRLWRAVSLRAGVLGACRDSLSGDSGGPVIEVLGGGGVVWAVGLHRAATGLFSPIDAALNEFNQAMPGGAFSVISIGQ